MMTPTNIWAWRKRLGISQGEAAKRIGIGRRHYQRMEHGDVKIPRTVELACAALALGLMEFPGQPD